LTVGGCERPQEPVPPTAEPQPAMPPTPQPPPPVLEPGEAAPGTEEREPAASTEPSPAYIAIDQARYEFPPAKLRLRSRGNGVSALLMSDDPPAAIRDDYTGNSFYLEIELAVRDVSDLAGTVIRYQAPSSQRVDSPNGIFLEGGRKQLQPLDVRAEFSGTAPILTVHLSGTFLMFDTQDHRTPDRSVPVRSEMLARVN
jgi:hypothetical protein